MPLAPSQPAAHATATPTAAMAFSRTSVLMCLCEKTAVGCVIHLRFPFLHIERALDAIDGDDVTELAPVPSLQLVAAADLHLLLGISIAVDHASGGFVGLRAYHERASAVVHQPGDRLFLIDQILVA